MILQPVASHKERNSLIFFTFLYNGSHSFVVKPSTNHNFLSRKTRALLKSPAVSVCFLSRRKHQPTKNRFVTTAVNLTENWENFLPNRPCPPLLKPLVTAVSCFRASNPREHFDFRSRFLCFQTANQKIRINSKILCLQSPSILVPRLRRLRDEKRAMGTRMRLTKCGEHRISYRRISRNKRGNNNIT